MRFSFSSFFRILAIFQVLLCAFLPFHDFVCFWPYSRSYSVCMSFTKFFSFLDIFKILPCEFLILLICQFSCHILGPTVCASLSTFSVFSPYSGSYSVHFSFFTFSSLSRCIFCAVQCVPHYPLFQFSLHIPGPTVYMSHFSHFSVFSP